MGPQRKQWTLHKNLLCYYSSYFETEFESYEGSQQNERSTLELPDDDSRGFELLVKYLYQGRLDGNAATGTDEERYEHAVSCQKLYTLSTRLHLSYLSNLAIDVYRANLNAAQLVPDADEINEIYRSSLPDSKMRKLMVRIAARQIMDPGVEKDADAYRDCFEDNPDFAVEMVNAIREMTGGGMLFEDPTKPSDACKWHDHEDGSQCSATGSNVTDSPRAPRKIGSPGTRRKPSAEVARMQSTPKQSPLVSNQTPADETVSSAPELLQPATFSSATPKTVNAGQVRSSSHSKPRKLDRASTSRAGVTNSTSSSTPSIANESRKMAPAAKAQPNGHVNGAQSKTIARTQPSKTTTPARQQINTYHVNGIVRQFDSMNGTISESGTSASTTRRQPPKLKRNS